MGTKGARLAAEGAAGLRVTGGVCDKPGRRAAPPWGSGPSTDRCCVSLFRPCLAGPGRPLGARL